MVALQVDCYMSLNVQYAIELATKCLPLNIEWWEEVLHPQDEQGFVRLKSALPQLKWTTGEVRTVVTYQANQAMLMVRTARVYEIWLS